MAKLKQGLDFVVWLFTKTRFSGTLFLSRKG